MKKIIMYSLLILLTQTITHKTKGQANKQHSLSINFGPELFAPENFWLTHTLGTGVSLKGEYTFGKHASTTFNTGFSYFGGKQRFDNPITGLKETYDPIVAIPIKLGGRYYLGNFYFLGETGAIIMANYSSGTKAIFSAGLGDKIKIGRNKLDISARQEIWLGSSREQYNMAVLRIAYELNL
jgi:hypothetical protein